MAQNASQPVGAEPFGELVYPQSMEFELIRLEIVQVASPRTRKDLNFPYTLPIDGEPNSGGFLRANSPGMSRSLILRLASLLPSSGINLASHI